MSTSIALSSAALAQSSVAASVAAKARHDACTVVISTYEAKTASIEQAKSYASCVEVLHPTSADVDPMALRVIVAVLIVGFLIGGYSGFMEDHTDGFTIAFHAFFGAFAALVLIAIVSGVMFVFTG